jgi:nucleotide-binding universal stress UspA family protein
MMIKIERILCPVDFSDFSAAAMREAMALARWYGASLLAMHVRPVLSGVWGHLPDLDPAALEPVPPRNVLEEVDRALRPARKAGVTTRAHVTQAGDVARALVEFAGAEAVDLIVMGTHGRGGLTRLALGSTAESVVRKSPCPVLTLHRDHRPDLPPGPPFRRILCPLDFSPPSRRALDHALALAQEAGGELTVLHVSPTVADERGFLNSEAWGRLASAVPSEAADWCELRHLLSSGNVGDEILRVAAQAQVDLIVMGVHGRNALDVLLFGSTTQEIVRRARCPVMTLSGAPATAEGRKEPRAALVSA